MDISLKEAAQLQKALASKVVIENISGAINYVAGVDVSQLAFKQNVPFYAGVVILSFPDLEVVEKVHHSEIVTFPYIPGFLAFREAPIIIKTLEKLETKPDVIIVDGHGISHPRRLGIASHIGVLTGYRTVGCAKSPMAGEPKDELPSKKGSFVPLYFKGEVVGNMVRTKDNVNPVYVSAGHRINLEKATELVLDCTTKYRLPEPTRKAHEWANYVRRNNM